MIAFSIISLVLVGIYQLQSQNIALGAHARFNSTAPMLAQKKAADILSDSEDLSDAGSGDFEDPFTGYHWRT
jgi:Tfp pilus assembly protein PilV